MDDTKEATTGELLPPNTRVLSNGAIYDTSIGRIVKGPTNPPIHAGNAKELRKKQIETTRRKLAQSIADKSREIRKLDITGPASAVADAGALLWGDIVLDDKAPARERRETWLAIGRQAGLLTDARESADNAPMPAQNALQDAIQAAIYGAIQQIRAENSPDE